MPLRGWSEPPVAPDAFQCFPASLVELRRQVDTGAGEAASTLGGEDISGGVSGRNMPISSFLTFRALALDLLESICSLLGFGDLDQLLAEVLALEEAKEGFRSVLETVLDVFFDGDLARCAPRAEIRNRLAELRGVIEQDESAHGESMDHDLHDVARAGRELGNESCDILRNT